MIAAGTLAVIAGLVFAFEPLESFWQRWRAGRAVQRASAFARAGDIPNAVLSLEIAAKLTSFDPGQLRVVADVLRQAGSPQAVEVYRQLVDMYPTDVPLHETGVRTALRFGDAAAAEAMLASVEPSKRIEPAFARLAADVADATGRSADYEKALRELLTYSPNDTRAQLELANLCLARPSLAETARETLRRLAASTAPERLPARQLLARDAAARNLPVGAVEWARALARDPEAKFSDRLFQLQLEHELRGPNEDQLLKNLQSTTASMPNEAATLATWMLLHDQTTPTEVWLKSLAPAVRESMPIRRVYADVAVISRDWSTVAQRLQAGSWGNLNATAVDLALASKLLQERGRIATAAEVWNEAVSAAGRNVPSLMALYRLSLAGGKAPEIDATLRALARAEPIQPWAVKILARRAHAERNTAALRDAYAVWLEVEPQNPRIQAEWAFASLLVERQVSPRLEEHTRGLYEHDRGDTKFAIVRAFCLWRSQRANEALQVLATLPPAELKKPGHALIYAAVLGSVGRAKEAAPYIECVKPATLLPEETEILREAVRSAAKAE